MILYTETGVKIFRNPPGLLRPQTQSTPQFFKKHLHTEFDILTF